MEPTYFESAASFRAWLEIHHADTRELLIGFYKKHTNHDGLAYTDAILEALCFGWIDGHVKSIDADRFRVRFTPRQARSIWSRVNIARVERLIAAGRMTAAGLAAYHALEAAKCDVYSYEQTGPGLGPEYDAKFRAARAAYAFFDGQAPSYQRIAIHWVMRAKKEETRWRRLDALIEVSTRGARLPQFVSPTGSKKVTSGAPRDGAGAPRRRSR